MMRKSFIMLSLILVTLIALPVSQINAGSIEIANTNMYLDSQGVLYILGEVDNKGSKPIKYVEISAILYDADDSAIDTISTFAMLDAIPPGRSSPFQITYSVPELSQTVRRFEVYVSDAATVSPRKQTLEVLSHDLSLDSQGLTHLAGNVKNNALDSSFLTQVVATFYDKEGNMLAATFTLTEPMDVIAGGTAQFEFVLDERELPKALATYSLAVQSKEYDQIQGVVKGQKSLEETPSSDVKREPISADISVAMKIKKKSIVLAIKNNDEIPIYGLQITSADGSITSISAKKWQSEKTEPSTVLIHTDDTPITRSRNMIVILKLDNKDAGLEWAAFDAKNAVLSSGTLTAR